jgi:hypothetical protein
MKYLLPLVLFTALLAACGPTSASTPAPESPATSPGTLDSPTSNPVVAENPREEPPAMPFAPQPGDANLTRGIIFIEEKGLVIRESYPPQIALGISGNLPTPCHEIRAKISEPDAENKINVDVYSVVDPNMMCTQVLKPFMENIELGTYPSGHYSVWLNGEMMGEFDS